MGNPFNFVGEVRGASATENDTTPMTITIMEQQTYLFLFKPRLDTGYHSVILAAPCKPLLLQLGDAIHELLSRQLVRIVVHVALLIQLVGTPPVIELSRPTIELKHRHLYARQDQQIRCIARWALASSLLRLLLSRLLERWVIHSFS